MDFTKFLIRIGIILSIPAILAIATFLYMKSYLFDPIASTDTKIELVEVPNDANAKLIGEILTEEQFIKAPWVFSTLATLRSDGSNFNSGEYELSRNMTPRQIIDVLASGKVFKRDFAFQEGLTIWEVAGAIEKAGIANKEEFIDACTDQQLLIRAGIKADSFEGYLHPGAYKFSKTESVARIIWKLLEEGENAWKAEYTDRAEELKLSRHEVLTLASLLTAETENNLEMPAISGVYHNRLMNLMKLESLPALRYGLEDPTLLVSPEMQEDSSNPYNTFVHYGLPPGPINNPGEEAIKAALYFQEHQFLFFVDDGAGGHRFAETLKEFNKLKAETLLE